MPPSKKPPEPPGPWFYENNCVNSFQINASPLNLFVIIPYNNKLITATIEIEKGAPERTISAAW